MLGSSKAALSMARGKEFVETLLHNKPVRFVVTALLLLAYILMLHALLGQYIGRKGVVYLGAGTALLALTYLKGIEVLVNSAVFACSLFATSSFLFAFFEAFPGLIPRFHLNILPYYSARLDTVPDPILRKRNRPLFSTRILDFRGSDYSPIYGIDVPPTTVDWSTDEEGFRNSATIRRADIAVIGDSLVEYGDNEADTFGKRLGKLTAMTVKNLGVSGYGPDQYLEVLKRYGVKLRPKYAFFSFYEGNDIADIREYRRFRQGDPNAGLGEVFSDSFWRRYKVAVTETINYLQNTFSVASLLVYKSLSGTDSKAHPDVAVLNLNGQYSRRRFFSLFSVKRDAHVQEMLGSWEWQRLKQILVEFRSVCVANNISPVIIYIPSDVHIYATYSTQDSGENWREQRDRQIALKDNAEKAMKQVAQELHVDMISLTPVFKAAANAGKMLYYSLDSHWNSEGRAVAAEYVAGILRERQTNSRDAKMR